MPYMVKERNEISLEDRWNVESLYPSPEEWKKDFAKWQGEEGKTRWPKLAAFKGTLSEGPKAIRAALECYLELERNLTKLYTYAHLRHDEDVAQDDNKQAYIRATSLYNTFREETAWFEPELLQIENLDLRAKDLQPYRVYLEKIIRLKPHTLAAEQEELLAGAGVALDAAHRAFGAFNNADLKFPSVQDSQGKTYELTHGKYLLYLRNKDRTLRKNSYTAFHEAFAAYENTLCELINGQVQKHLFLMKARNYPSCLDAALFQFQVDPSVYRELIQAVRANLGSLHQYLDLRRQLLGYDELHMYDLHVPLVPNVDLSMDYKEAEKLVIEAMAPLGKEYQNDLRKGLEQDRWVDRYENNRKRSGAYSSGCYDSMPYILLNFQGNFQDLMTFSHEAGHSMHSLLSHRHQPYQDSQYPIFVAEVASTFHEEMLKRHMLSKISDKAKRAYLLNQKIEDIRNTFFRQTMFAEFELKIHEFAQAGVPLTPTLLKQEYRKLNVDYFGPNVVVDPQTDIEWARIPHFYYNFYVYQYATGISAAHALVDKVEKEGPEKYLKFLSSGGSRFPLDLLAMAGVDMRKPEAVEATIHHFENLSSELKKALI